jgi:uncharacterized spore protein YtfJ
MATESTRATSDIPNSGRIEFDEFVEQQDGDFFSRIIDGTVGRVLNTVDSGLVYGEPISQGERTVIPVSKIKFMYGFGGGAGYGVNDDPDEGSAGSGSGGGGGGNMQANAVGFIELTPTSTQFTPIIDRNPLLRIGAIVAGIVVVLLVTNALRRG